MITKRKIASMAWVCVLLAGAAIAGETQTKKTDWCEITVPKTAKVGEQVEVKIKLIGIKDTVFIFCDFKDTDHQMLKWGGPGRELGENGETTYQFPVADRKGLKSAYAYIMLCSDKEGKKQLKADSTPEIEVTGAAAFPDIGYNKSWIAVDASNGGKPLVEGDKWEVIVDYFLDPSEELGGTTLNVWGTGPWIDCPDGKYETKRHHVGFATGIRGSAKIKPGKGQQAFTFTVPPALPQVARSNGILLILNFVGGGKEWPWQVRSGNGFVRKGGFFDLTTDKPGNLFTYQEPVKIVAKLRNVKEAGQEKVLTYSVHDTSGVEATKGEVKFTAEKDGQEVAIPLELKSRGTFLIETEVAGWEKRKTTFARIPDVLAVTKGGKTAYGMTNALSEDACRVAQRLGLTACRRFTSWNSLEPGPGVYKLEGVEKELEMARKYGIEPWICLVDPPAWVLKGKGANIGYSSFSCDLDGLRDFVKTATEKYKGKLYAWEWLNEIVPGGSPTCVDDYVNICRVGTETAKAVDPNIVTMLAGGLWPRSFRTSVLAAGAGKYVDVLPVHYANGGAVLEAREDLNSAGCDKVAVWDDESSQGRNAWNVPPLEELKDTGMCNWVLTQWTDEMAAGCERIIFFGGDGDPAGNWTYMLDDYSPRPAAATLAVYVSKMHGAKAVGVFSLGKSGLFHLFERDGKPLVVASTYEKSEKVDLAVGTEKVTLSDYQGNETETPSAGGKAELSLTPLRYFLEGADLDVLKAYVVPSIQVSRTALKRSKLVETPHVTMLRGRPAEFFIRVRNLYDRDLEGSFKLELPEGWPAKEPTSFALKPGEDKLIPVALTIADTIAPKDYEVNAAFEFGWKKLPKIVKPAVFSVISAEMLGSLLPNGDFETPDAAGTGPEGWALNGKTKTWVSSEGLGDGLGKHCLKFIDSNNQWEHCGRSIDLRGGQTYLYTAWIWNQNMSAGSNIDQVFADGTTKSMYDVHVFTAGQSNPSWQVFTCRYKAPENVKTVGFTPVVNGKGWALYDNIRVTFFEGTDFAAEAYRCKTPPKIDGNLDEWTTKCPIPLIGKNQVTVLDKAYAWTPQNLNAIGYLMWDDANLYVAVKVRDDVASAGTTGDETIQGDSLILAFDPTNRRPDGDTKSFCYYLSAAKPGGGSGKHTIFRPKDHSAGLQSGHLFKDSSIYEMAVTPCEGGCVYEVRIPWSELGGTRPGLGNKFGFSIQLNDNDGQGRAAHMNWGGGISPKWQPKEFGVATLLE